MYTAAWEFSVKGGAGIKRKSMCGAVLQHSPIFEWKGKEDWGRGLFSGADVRWGDMMEVFVLHI